MDEKPIIEGSCLCGNVTYHVAGRVSDVVHCHCRTCRKAHGSAFASMASVSLEDFRLEGDAHLGCYESSPGKKRYFCTNCGTHIYTRRDGKDSVGLSLGALDGEVQLNEFARIWISDRASWYDLDADLPRYARSWRDAK